MLAVMFFKYAAFLKRKKKSHWPPSVLVQLYLVYQYLHPVSYQVTEKLQQRALSLKLRQIKGIIMHTYCKNMFCSYSNFVTDCEDTRRSSNYH